MQLLTHELCFPPVETADEHGLLAIGGDLSTERLLLAYRNGIFPWFNDDEPPLWWCPDPRYILIPEELVISKSMKGILKNSRFQFTINKDFSAVIKNCQQAKRKEQDGTWITNETEAAYTELHRLGFAHSAEAWLDGQLVGGLYGVRLGKVFFGESMFNKESNASKFAFLNYVQQLISEKVALIDCQVYTVHLESLGAKMMNRKLFIERLNELIP